MRPPQTPRTTSGHAEELPIARLRIMVRKGLARGKASAVALASQLDLHRRTLNRRLQARGTTYQRILDDVRFELACELLAEGTLSVAEISSRLGYAETSAFSRAFRRWSGTSPARWRATPRDAATATRAAPRGARPPSAA
jgi:AraC-like DNA-binding protein